MFNLAHAREIYAFFTPDGRKRDFTIEKTGSLLRQQLDLPLFDAPSDLDLDDVNSPNRIPADRAQEAIIYVLEKIFGLKAAEGKLGSFERVYKIFTSKGKGGYYQSLFRITISHTFFKVEQKSKRPNISKSKADCIKKYQAYWVPVRVSKSLKGEWSLSEPYVPEMFVDTTTGTTITAKGCPVTIIDDKKKKKEWADSTEIGKMSLITLALSLKTACAEVIRFSGKDADTIFRSSNFCAFFFFIKRVIEEATESVVLPYLTSPRDTRLPIKISGSTADRLEQNGYEIIGTPQIFMPSNLQGLFAAQYAERDMIKRLVSLEWTSDSDDDVKSLIRSYDKPQLNSSFINLMALNHPIIQLLVPSTFVNIKYKDITNDKEIEVLWKYGSINEAILAVGCPFHQIYDMYPDLSYEQYVDGQNSTTALARDITRLTLKDSLVSLVFVQAINRNTLQEFYLLNSLYLDAELVNNTIGAVESFIEEDFTDGGEYEEITVPKSTYTRSVELNQILCSSLKLVFNIVTNFGETDLPPIYISDLLTSNVPKSRALSILFDCLRTLACNVAMPDEGSMPSEGLLQIVSDSRG